MFSFLFLRYNCLILFWFTHAVQRPLLSFSNHYPWNFILFTLWSIWFAFNIGLSCSYFEGTTFVVHEKRKKKIVVVCVMSTCRERHNYFRECCYCYSNHLCSLRQLEILISAYVNLVFWVYSWLFVFMSPSRFVSTFLYITSCFNLINSPA